MSRCNAERLRSLIGFLGAPGGLILLTLTLAQAQQPPDPFAGFPAIGKTSKGQRSTKVIASDPIKGLVRPKWTRAMADLGSGTGMYRYRGDIYFTHGVGDGHHGVAKGVKPQTVRYVSKDEGKSWKPAPVPDGGNSSGSRFFHRLKG